MNWPTKENATPWPDKVGIKTEPLTIQTNFSQIHQQSAPKNG